MTAAFSVIPYYTTQLGLKDCTLVSVMEKADFPKWLQNQKIITKACRKIS